MELSPGCKTSGPGFGLGVQGFMALGIRVLMGFSVLGFCPHPVHVSSWGVSGVWVGGGRDYHITLEPNA